MGCGIPAQRIGGELLMADYLTTDTDLTAVADAIREKGGTSAALEWPSGYVDAIDAIETGGGDAAGPFVKSFGTQSFNANVYYSSYEYDFADSWSPITAGSTCYIRTGNDYYLENVTREDTGESVPFTTESTNQYGSVYSFVMPNANVTYSIYYDD